jgi:RNA polymerase sigma factor (sigma-70 family)
MIPSAHAQTWVPPDFSAIAFRIQRGDTSAESELVNGLTRGVRFVAGRRLGESPDVDETVTQVFEIAIGNIRAGKLEDHQGVAGYVRTILTHLVEERLERRTRARSGEACSVTHIRVPERPESPEQTRSGRQEHVQRVLRSLSQLDQEVLRRFYLNEEPQKQICEEMGLSLTEFRLIKSRVAAKLALDRAPTLQVPARPLAHAVERLCVKT